MVDIKKQSQITSMSDIQKRAIALNQIYFLDVFKSEQDGMWYGGVWKKENCSVCQKDECQGCIDLILFLSEGFSKPQYAACHLNKTLDATKLSPETEKKIGLTNSDLALLKKLEVRPTQRENASAFRMKQTLERSLY